MRRVPLVPAMLLVALAGPLRPAGAQEHGAVCAAVAALIADDSARLAITRDTVLTDPRTGETLRGCVITLEGSRAAQATGPAPDERVRDGLLDLGWREHLHYAADGPDGTAFALWRGASTCFVRADWDGGDDADPGGVPSDAYALTVGCVSDLPGATDSAPAGIESAWTAWRDGDVARAESLAIVLPTSDARSHLLFLGALVRGAYDDALSHHARIGAAYERRAELDGPVVDAYLHLGRPADAHAFARTRGMEATTVAWLEQGAARPLAARLDTIAVVPFAEHPLTPYFPAFAAELDGRPTVVHFDTGAPFLVMGPTRAAALGIVLADAGTGLHGTRAVPMQRGLVGRFQLGDAVLENVPVAVLASLVGQQDFVIFGTNVLEQFHATLDYPNRRLILSPRSDDRWWQPHRAMLPGRSVTVPFYLWGDHYMFARGGFGTRRDLNYFIDSGLVSLAPVDGGVRQACVLATPAQYREWGVDSAAAAQRHFASPLPVSLGPLEQREQFFATVANPTWGSFGGVRIDGLLSHAFLSRYAWTIDVAGRRYLFTEP